METLTASSVRSDLFNVLRKTIKGHRQLRISSKEGNAILLSEEDFESIMESAHLLSIPGFVTSIRKADDEIEKNETISMEEAFSVG